MGARDADRVNATSKNNIEMGRSRGAAHFNLYVAYPKKLPTDADHYDPDSALPCETISTFFQERWGVQRK